MKRYFARRGWAIPTVLLIAAVTALSLVACKGSGRWRVEIHGPTGIGGSVRGEWDSDQGKVTESPGNGNCDLRFTGPSGNTTGTLSNVPVGQSFPIPPGTTGAVVTGVHPGGGTGGNQPGGGMFDGESGLAGIATTQSGGRSARTAAAPPLEHFIVFIPFDAAIDLGPGWGTLANVHADFRYRSTQRLSQDELFALVAPYVMSDIGNQPALAPGLDVLLFARCVPNANGRGGRLFVTDRTAGFESFRFEMNGVELATLQHDSLQYDAPNGWKVVETDIEWSDFSIDPTGGSTNTFRLTVDTLEDDEVGLGAIIEYS